MTRRAFCESRGMSPSMLDYYLRRYGRVVKPEKQKLVRVEVNTEPQGCAFTVVLANGRRIETAGSFADAELMRLIRVVEGA